MPIYPAQADDCERPDRQAAWLLILFARLAQVSRAIWTGVKLALRKSNLLVLLNFLLPEDNIANSHDEWDR